MKITPQEIKEHLMKADGHETAAEIASAKNCSPNTVRNKIKILREDGDAIIFNNDGLRLVDKESMLDPETAKDMIQFSKWVLSVVRGAARCARPTKKLLPSVKKTLMENYTAAERREIKHTFARYIALITYAEVDDEDF